MVRRRTVSKPVVSDVGSGAIRWGSEWHEVVGERKVAGLPTDGRSALDAGRGGTIYSSIGDDLRIPCAADDALGVLCPELLRKIQALIEAAE